MRTTVTDFFGDTLTYRKCIDSDIPTHFKYVRNVVDAEDKDAYIQLMRDSVNAGTAYCVEGTGVFLYLLVEDEYVLDGVAMSAMGKPAHFWVLLRALIYKEHPGVHFVRFLKHKNTNLAHFTTMADPSSLRSHSLEIVIRVSRLTTMLGLMEK